MRIEYRLAGKQAVFQKNAPELVVGRSSNNAAGIDLNLAMDTLVSRRHARVGRDGNGRFWIEDIDSKHGTHVGGVNIKGRGRVELPPGTEVRIGDTRLTVGPDQQAPPGETEDGPALVVSVQCEPEFNYALAHNDIPRITAITLHNQGERPLSGIRIRLTLHGYAEFSTPPVANLAAGERVTLRSVRLQCVTSALKDLDEAHSIQMEAWLGTERVPLAPPVTVKVLPPRAWRPGKHQESLAGFVLPNCRTVNTIVARARVRLRRYLPGVAGFADAVVSATPDACERICKAIYQTLRRRRPAIAYEWEPPTYADWQLLRLPREVLVDREGTCIDLAVLFAACLENVHLHPLILFISTGKDGGTGTDIQHALMGCWQPGKWAAGSAILNGATTRRLVDKGDILVLESQGFPQTNPFPEGMTFEECGRRGLALVQKHGALYALDVRGARERGLMPLPLGSGLQYDREAALALARAEREAAALTSSAVGVRHLLLALLATSESPLWQALDRDAPGRAERV
ncbi:MAG TPA: FHA domain-containing protein, partial [Gemmataceae bacterium]|nr:FHA domain-containing protein [Gemmataceae bacterium]